jgi:hypothetical protein
VLNPGSGEKMSRITRALFLAGGLALAVFGIADTASAATQSYTNHASITVPNNSGIAGIPDPVTVPAGRTPVQSVEVSNAQPIWSSGGTDFEMWLIDPSGSRLDLMTIGCPVMNPGTHFAVRDSAAIPADDTIAFCNNQLNGGEGKPNDPGGGTFASKYNGKPTAGTWTLFLRDAGVIAGGGVFNDWTLTIVHAPFVLTDSANKQKLKKSLLINASCNANCSLSTSGDAKATTFSLAQNQSQQLRVPLTKKARKRLAEKGKAKIGLSAADGYGDLTSATLKVKLKRK